MMRGTSPAQKVFYLPNTMKHIAAFVAPVAQTECISGHTVVLITSFYLLRYHLLLTPQGEWMFHTRFLSSFLYGEPTNTHPPGSEPAFLSTEILADGVRPLE